MTNITTEEEFKAYYSRTPLEWVESQGFIMPDGMPGADLCILAVENKFSEYSRYLQGHRYEPETGLWLEMQEDGSETEADK